MMYLPEIRDRVPFDHIDGTPNGRYALRILKAYRQRCNEKWILEGCDEKTRRIYDAMNEHQDLRAKELDEAISILERKEREQVQSNPDALEALYGGMIKNDR